MSQTFLADYGPKENRARSSDCLRDSVLDDTKTSGPSDVDGIAPSPSECRELQKDGLLCTYRIMYSRRQADAILAACESSIAYIDDARVKVFGQWCRIPRKQAAYGDDGRTYTFAGCTVKAKPWLPLLKKVCQQVSHIVGCEFNFVLINRYKDGSDSMGEHRDNEAELEPRCPIASLSFGQSRDFVFRRYMGCKTGQKRSHAAAAPETLKLNLEHGSLLVMYHPTNQYWTHALPPRKTAPGVRINMTFRRMRT